MSAPLSWSMALEGFPEFIPSTSHLAMRRHLVDESPALTAVLQAQSAKVYQPAATRHQLNLQMRLRPPPARVDQCGTLVASKSTRYCTVPFAYVSATSGSSSPGFTGLGPEYRRTCSPVGRLRSAMCLLYSTTVPL